MTNKLKQYHDKMEKHISEIKELLIGTKETSRIVCQLENIHKEKKWIFNFINITQYILIVISTFIIIAGYLGRKSGDWRIITILGMLCLFIFVIVLLILSCIFNARLKKKMLDSRDVDYLNHILKKNKTFLNLPFTVFDEKNEIISVEIKNKQQLYDISRIKSIIKEDLYREKQITCISYYQINKENNTIYSYDNVDFSKYLGIEILI